MAKPDREVLFSNERFLIGVLQVVSGGALVAALAQREALIELAGRYGFLLFVTAMVFALVVAVLAAYSKHAYKLWESKAGVSASQAKSAARDGDEAKFVALKQEAERRSNLCARHLGCG